MELEILTRFLLAVLWGGLVGAEREYRSKSAGFRTMIMISLGSCFFTMLSQSIGGAGNPDRIASNIVTGIGFLGAGVIFRGENRVNGITTAATIWAVAAVGMGIGAGDYIEATTVGVLVLVVLAVLPYLEVNIEKLNQYKTYHIQGTDLHKRKSTVEEMFKANRLHYKLTRETKDGNEYSMSWQAQGKARHHEKFTAEMMEQDWAERFEY
jgi:putative Mg2+ transporter-C (MgtC) family protein